MEIPLSDVGEIFSFIDFLVVYKNWVSFRTDKEEYTNTEIYKRANL